MKKTLVFTLLIALMALPFTTAQADILTNLTYYSFDVDGSSTVGFDNDFTFSGNVGIDSRSGFIGAAGITGNDTSTGVAQTGLFPINGTDPFTLAFWTARTLAPNDNGVIFQLGSQPDQFGSFTNGGTYFFWNGGTADTGITMDAGWQLMTFSYDGSQYHITKNVTTVEKLSAVGHDLDPESIHLFNHDAGGDPWIAQMDEFMFWHGKNLTSSEISTLLACGEQRVNIVDCANNAIAFDSLANTGNKFATDIANWSVNIQDINLTNCWFAQNDTGTFVNVSVPCSGTSATLQGGVVITADVGASVCGYFGGTGFSNSNQTAFSCIEVIEYFGYTPTYTVGDLDDVAVDGVAALLAAFVAFSVLIGLVFLVKKFNIQLPRL